MQELFDVKVLDRKTINERGILITFESSFPFSAGQVVGVTTSSKIPPRLYSLAGGDEETHQAIFFDVQEGGALTPLLARLQPGDTFWATAPHGSFLHSEDDSVWIATGTGVAPFRSMVRSGVRPQLMIHGGREFADLFFEPEFSVIDSYIKCITREAHPGALRMRLTEYLAQRTDLPLDLKYYLCGSTGMVVDVRNLLISKGVPFDRIVTEIYF